MAAMDRWIFHLSRKHPETDAPCLGFLGAAQQRLHERRRADATPKDVVRTDNGTAP